MSKVSRYLPSAARIVLGAVFTLFGLNFFLHFLPMPPPSGRAAAFLGGLFASGYLLQLTHLVELGAGLALLANRFVPLALTLLAPIIVNIVAFHLFLAPQGLAVPLVVLASELYLAWHHRAVFAPMAAVRASGGIGARAQVAVAAPLRKAA